VILILFAVKNRYNRIKSAKYSRLLSQGYAHEDEEEEMVRRRSSLQKLDKAFHVQFDNLALTLPSKVKILQGVSGALHPARVMAILGGSGSGKTTLLNVLAGKLVPSKGHVTVNGNRNASLSDYRKLVGYVPQNDIMLRELTVRDILMHAALSSLPKDMSAHAKKQKVLDVINFFDLGSVMDSVIGTEEEKGLSGGQVKRVNIGMELVKMPSVLLLDEPTTGLDATTALELCTMLKHIARQQRLTVAAVVHSPSPDAFAQFDDMTVLSKGGQVIYTGPVDDAPAYFSSIGFPVPPEENPADFYISVAAGKVPSLYTVMELPALWKRHASGESFSLPRDEMDQTESVTVVETGSSGMATPIPPDKQSWPSFFHTIGSAFRTGIVGTARYIWDVLRELVLWIGSILVFWRRDPVRDTPNPFVVFWLCLKRASMQIYRSRWHFLSDQLLHLGIGAFISIAARQFDYLGRQPPDICNVAPIALRRACASPQDFIAEFGVFVALGVLYAGISVGSSTFGHEREVFWRDTASGQPTLPYFIAKVIADIPRVLFAAVCFTLAFIVFYPYRSSMVDILLVIFLLYLSSFAMGYLVSIVARPVSAGLVGTAFALAWAIVFSGIVPDLEDIQRESGYDGLRWLWLISAPRWAIEALFLKEIAARPFYEIRQDSLAHTYHFDDYPVAIGMMLAIACMWNLLSLLALKLVHRDKHK
jgi:ABC-type multidrug transport system ATPase subunit